VGLSLDQPGVRTGVRIHLSQHLFDYGDSLFLIANHQSRDMEQLDCRTLRF
jgi:hypothetical protein